ncbi:MAG: hypothetical protein KDE20_15620 [Caldilineaceae bacterium]|nr:hypothetical protein [Caldilineaceae bacterium]
MSDFLHPPQTLMAALAKREDELTEAVAEANLAVGLAERQLAEAQKYRDMVEATYHETLRAIRILQNVAEEDEE